MKKLFLVLRRSWEALTADDQGQTTKTIIPACRHEVERIPNPACHGGFWLVLKGTKTGGGERYWRQWEDYDDEWRVTIEEEPA